MQTLSQQADRKAKSHVTIIGDRKSVVVSVSQNSHLKNEFPVQTIIK